MTQEETQDKSYDDIAIAMFAAAMKNKMDVSRIKGRTGWQDCSVDDLLKMFNEHVEKGDFIDIGNFSMMLWFRTQKI